MLASIKNAVPLLDQIGRNLVPGSLYRLRAFLRTAHYVGRQGMRMARVSGYTCASLLPTCRGYGCSCAGVQRCPNLGLLPAGRGAFLPVASTERCPAGL